MTAPPREPAATQRPSQGAQGERIGAATKKTPDVLWMNGKLVPWASATVHVSTHALHYGSSVFEGMRCYDTPRGPALFRAREHMRRFIDSGKVYRMTLPGIEELIEASKLVVRVNGCKDPIETMIMAMPWGAYLGEGALENGVDVGISTWNRPGPNTLPQGAKAGGNYLSGQLIVMEAERLGYHEGIALDIDGT